MSVKSMFLNLIIFRLFVPLPQLTKEGYRVSLSRLNDPDVGKFECADYVKVNFMSIDIRVSRLDMYKKEIFIFDLDKFSMGHLTTILPQLKKFIYCGTVSILLNNCFIIIIEPNLIEITGKLRYYRLNAKW